MALLIKDRIKETSTTSGTGTLTLDGASTGFASFSEIGSGNTTYYVITNSTDWEVGIGTVGTGTLSRDTILASSNAGSAVSWTSAIKDVFCTYPAEKAVYEQSSGLVEVPSLNINSSTTVDGVLDEDTLVSNSATKLATQQSIKAYVDSNSSAVTDGDKGDVVVSSSGSVWTVESAAGAFDVTGDLTVDTNTLHVDSTNNYVGIGTSSPSHGLHIDSNNLALYSSYDSFNGLLRFYGQDGAEKLQMGVGSGTSAFVYATDGTDLIMYAGGSEAMRMLSSGRLLVGTTTVSDSRVNIETTEQFSPTASKTTNAISIIQEGGTQGNGNYSTGITFSKINSSSAGAAIVSKQTSTDADQLGLAFLTHGSATTSETLTEAAVLDHAGNFFVNNVFPSADNTGVVGNSANTYSNGQFTSFTVTSTLTVRSAIDLADNDVLRLGSSDDAELFCNGSDFLLDLNSGINDFIIRDGTTERFRFVDSGNLLIGKSTGDVTTVGLEFNNNGTMTVVSDSVSPMYVRRNGTDGVMVSFYNDGTLAGYISVSGSTTSYVGGHLSRWTHVDSDNGSLLKGTVMTNLDEMCVWKQAVFTTQQLVTPAVEAIEAVDEIPEERDDEGNIIQEYVPAVEPREAQEAVYQDVVREELYYGDAVEGDTVDFEYDGQIYSATIQYEENEQLNKNAVSSVEGDPNVSGVFVNYDDDGDVNLAMTGDMVIRIAQGTTVARGDLLMSAGDGTAKPQGDDIVRSKTIAKVTSTSVTKTYNDGSYLVPCVLMAC